MVTDQYSHILDDDRKHNADLFEQAFYSGKGAEAVSGTSETAADAEDSTEGTAVSGADVELIAKVLANPEMAALLKALAANIK